MKESYYIIHDPDADLSLLPSAFAQGRRLITEKGDLSRIREPLSGRNCVLVMPNAAVTKAVLQLRMLDLKAVFVMPTDIGYRVTQPIRIDPDKPRLDYMETELSHICNLNCRGCCDFCNLQNGGSFYDYDSYCSDLRQMKKLFWGIEKIRLMGGEPFLTPNLIEYVKYTKSLFPDSDIRIVTNGLLIPDYPDASLRELSAIGCRIEISGYPPTIKAKKQIADKLNRNRVRFLFGVPMLLFWKNILSKGRRDPESAFANCPFTHCHMMGDGKLSPCSFAYCIGRFNEHFGTDYPEDDYIDLYAPDLDAWEVRRRVSEPHGMCACCSPVFVPIPWKGHCSPESAKPEDWLIRPNRFLLSVFPAVQRTVKPLFIALRAIKQRIQ